MKLSRLLLAGFAAFALTGCDLFGKKEEPAKEEYDLNPEITGGTEEEKTAILETLNKKPICMKNGTSSSEIFYDARPILMEDEGDNIKLTVKQTVSGKTVDITWGLDETQEYFDAWLKPSTDPTHWFIQIDYKGYEYGHEHGDGSLSWKITKMQCGDAVAANPGVTYNATIKNEQYFHEDKTIAWCYKFTDTVFEKTVGDKTYKIPATFDVIDYDKVDDKGGYSPYYKTNNPDAAEKQYYYVNVTGKVIYLAPDGNFGLIADGDEVMEIYAGGGTALKESNFPNLKLGNVVKISGNLGQFCGNVQLGFITKVLAGNASAITAPTNPLTFREMTAEKIASLTKSGFTDPSQAVKVDGVDMMGSLRSVTGKLKAGSLYWCDGDADSADSWKTATPDTIKSGKRFRFVLTVGEKEYTVAYDYHVCRNSSTTLFDNLKSALSSGKDITVKGFSRYFGNNSSPFNQEGQGAVWSVVPFDAAHVSVAA